MFSGRQITVVVASVSAAALFMPMSVMAADSTTDRAQAAATRVKVSNFPATQKVNGNVAVTNLPATQKVAGAISVTNLPATQQVAGSVTVANSAANAIPVSVVATGQSGTPFVKWIDTYTADDPINRLRPVLAIPPASRGVQVEQLIYSSQGGSDSATLASIDVAAADGCDGLRFADLANALPLVKFYAKSGNEYFTPARPITIAPPTAVGAIRCLVVSAYAQGAAYFTVSGTQL